MSTVESMIATLKSHPPLTLMRWYADLNSWRNPEDFPITLEERDERAGQSPAEYRKRHPLATMAFDAITKVLSEQQRSWAWWRFSIGREFADWREWWGSNHRPPVAINEDGEPA